jgi:hypothetical protein
MDNIEKIRRSEEIDHIVSRMPTRFGKRLTIIVASTVIVILILSWVIKYPDVNTGTVIINTNFPAVKLVSNTSGRLRLLKKNHAVTGEGEIMGYIETSTSISDFQKIDSLIKRHQRLNTGYQELFQSLPASANLGVLSEKYYYFVNALQQYINYYGDNLYGKQVENLQKLQEEQGNLLHSSVAQSRLMDSNLQIMSRFREMDSVLFSQKVLSVADYDRNKLNLLSSSLDKEQAKSSVTTNKINIHSTASALQELLIKKTQIEKELHIELHSSLQNLASALKTFEEAYVFRAPIAGTVQYLKFWNDNSFLSNSEPAFSIIPNNTQIIGQVTVPNLAAGKIKKNQEVIIKLDNYPFNEYGSIKGSVSDISLITTTQQTQQGNVEQYLVDVALPLGLQTNRGVNLEFRYELKGVAEIITSDKRLIQRVFDNIRYMVER